MGNTSVKPITTYPKLFESKNIDKLLVTKESVSNSKKIFVLSEDIKCGSFKYIIRDKYVYVETLRYSDEEKYCMASFDKLFEEIDIEIKNLQYRGNVVKYIRLFDASEIKIYYSGPETNHIKVNDYNRYELQILNLHKYEADKQPEINIRTPTLYAKYKFKTLYEETENYKKLMDMFSAEIKKYKQKNKYDIYNNGMKLQNYTKKNNLVYDEKRQDKINKELQKFDKNYKKFRDFIATFFVTNIKDFYEKNIENKKFAQNDFANIEFNNIIKSLSEMKYATANHFLSGLYRKLFKDVPQPINANDEKKNDEQGGNITKTEYFHYCY